MRQPSSMPGPRKLEMDVRLALSYDALKMYGIFSFCASAAIASAIFMACASLSITHGPAMRKSSAPPIVTGLFGMVKDFTTRLFYHGGRKNTEKSKSARRHLQKVFSVRSVSP